MTIAKPTTSAQARKLISELEAKHAALTATIAATADRRKGAAVSAEFGGDDAREALRKITAEATEAKDALQNLDSVIAEIRRLRDELAQDESTARQIAAAAAQDEAIDKILAVDDKLDAILDEARALFAERRELQRVPALRQLRIAKSAGSLTIREREMASTLLGYFDNELSHLSRAGEGYASLMRVADWDSKYWGKKSPAQIERGNRPLSPFERTWKASVDRIGWASRSGPGYDSSVEAAKRNGGSANQRRPVMDVSGGWDGGKDNPRYGS